MWIIPNNLPLYSHFAQECVASKEELKELLDSLTSQNQELPLMWRSKVGSPGTWLTRWKKVYWLPHLFGRTLKPSLGQSFTEKYTSSLEDILVSPLVSLENVEVQMTPDTSGLSSPKESDSCDPNVASLKTSQDTSISDTEKSDKIWKDLVTQLKKEYSVRKKLAHLIRESDSLSLHWRTPSVEPSGIKIERLEGELGSRMYDEETGRNCQYGLSQQVQWLTPRVLEVEEEYENYLKRMQASDNPKNNTKTNPGNLSMQAKMWTTPVADDTGTRTKNYSQGGTALSLQVTLWKTPTTQEVEHPNMELNEQGRRLTKDGDSHSVGLADQVKNWPTPSTRDYKGAVDYERTKEKLQEGKRAHMGALDNFTQYREIDGLPDQDKPNLIGKNLGLNPSWVFMLMNTTIEKTFSDWQEMV
jgi:hypothetical protein